MKTGDDDFFDAGKDRPQATHVLGRAPFRFKFCNLLLRRFLAAVLPRFCLFFNSADSTRGLCDRVIVFF